MQYFGFDRPSFGIKTFGFGAADAPSGDIPTDYILAYDFNGDVLDKSINGLDGIKTGSASFATGRKAGTQALYFTDGSVRTPSALPLNSNKVSISFWLKQGNTTSGILMEMNSEYSKNNFGVYSEAKSLPTRLILNSFTASSSDALYQTVGDTPIDVWVHAILTVNRSNFDDYYHRIYINGNDVTTYTANLTRTAADFTNAILHIGRRNSESLPFEGCLQDIRIYNRALNEAERTQLFNE